MTFFKRKTSIVFFIAFSTLLTSISLHAENSSKYFTQNSTNNIECTNDGCFFPSMSLTSNDIVVSGNITWDKNKNLILHTKGNIVFEKTAKLTMKSDGLLTLKVGMEPNSNSSNTTKLGKVIFNNQNEQISIHGKGGVRVYYHPDKGQEKHKYFNPQHSLYKNHISFVKEDNLTLYMLVNNIYDLQNIGAFLSSNYALSQNIDASVTKEWNKGKGFDPLKDTGKNMPFSGNFDGNGYIIENLYINRPEDKKVGLFGVCSGFESRHNIIENLTLRGFNITGNHYVGALAGWATNSKIFNVNLVNFSIKSRDIAGGLIGAMYNVQFYTSIFLNQQEKLEASKYKGYVAGSSNDCDGEVLFMLVGTKDIGKETPRDIFSKASMLFDEGYSYIGNTNNSNIKPDFMVTEKGAKDIYTSFIDYINRLQKMS